LETEIAKTNEFVQKAQEELDTLKQALALEKMAKTSAEADLDAVRNKKRDTSEADALRKELQALKDQHQASLVTAQQESAKATEEHLVTKASLEKALGDLQNQKAESDMKIKTSENDYLSMHNSLTELVEEAQKRTADLEDRLEEAEAKLKVKDAELAEEKVRYHLLKAFRFHLLMERLPQTKSAAVPSPKTPSSATKAPSGLRASKFAENVDEAPTNEAEEGEPDSSSAALASVREPFS
jgi:chromosome segregation ATPase